MKPKSRKRIGDLFVDNGLLTEDQINYALSSKGKEQKLGDFLVINKFITEQQLLSTLEQQLNLKHINLNNVKISTEVLKLVNIQLARNNHIMPVYLEDNKLVIAMSDPTDYFATEEIRMATGCHLEIVVASKDDITRAIIKYYELQESMDAAIDDLKLDNVEVDTKEAITDEDHPIVRLVNQMIATAIVERASDIHFDPDEDGLVLRHRVDGVLRTEKVLPKYMQSMITARIKIIGNLNITENRIPQDGRIKTTVNSETVDIRLSTLPTTHGEKIVMRILDSSNSTNNILDLNLSDVNYKLFQAMISKPNGIILITGPTGSGKSTTLYATLSHLNKEGTNIITVEDPVEYELSRVNQVQIKEEIGLDFATTLRSILRQDPDILMIGEIRDLETAKISTRAALTGHLVFSTLHTNSAVESISRLKDMGVEPFLISSSVLGVMAQRLVRKVCRDCSEIVPASEMEIRVLEAEGMSVTEVNRGKGCDVCNHTGYLGRVAIHELIPIDNTIKDLIINSGDTASIIKYAKDAGYKTLTQDGLIKVIQGLTTVEEVLRVATID